MQISLTTALLLAPVLPGTPQKQKPPEANRMARASEEGSAVYPVFAFGKVWGIAEDLYGGPDGKEELAGSGKLLAKLGIPVPTVETVLQEAKAQDVYYRSHYGPAQQMGKANSTFRELKNPESVIKQLFGRFPLRVQVTTSTGSFVTAINKVFVQMDDGCPEPYGIILYAFAAPADTAEPLFALAVENDTNTPFKMLGKAPAAGAKAGSPHLYSINFPGNSADKPKEVVLEERQTAGGAPQIRLATKDGRGQVIFEREFAHPNNYGSEMYLSPPLVVTGETLPWFVVYSLGARHTDAAGSSWGDWGYERVVFRLLASGELDEVSRFYIGIGGAQCD